MPAAQSCAKTSRFRKREIDQSERQERCGGEELRLMQARFERQFDRPCSRGRDNRRAPQPGKISDADRIGTDPAGERAAQQQELDPAADAGRSG